MEKGLCYLLIYQLFLTKEPIQYFENKMLIKSLYWKHNILLYPRSTGGGYTVLSLSFHLSVLPFVPRYFSSHFSQQLLMAEIWYLVTSFIYRRYAILWEAFSDPSDSYFLFTDLVGFYTHWTYMRGYHKWALAHSSSCWKLLIQIWLKSGKNWPQDNFFEICDFR